MKIVINADYGAFSISMECAKYMAAKGHERAQRELEEKKGFWYGFGYVDGMNGGYDRTDPMLIEAVEALGTEKASGRRAELKIVEVPDRVGWEIEECDGREWVSETHRTWR